MPPAPPHLASQRSRRVTKTQLHRKYREHRELRRRNSQLAAVKRNRAWQSTGQFHPLQEFLKSGIGALRGLPE
jgi:hypothetical protein